jgi:Flp pilus assembly protein TadB
MKQSYEAVAVQWFRLRYILIARLVLTSLWLPKGIGFGAGMAVTIIEWITIIRWIKRRRRQRHNRATQQP